MYKIGKFSESGSYAVKKNWLVTTKTLSIVLRVRYAKTIDLFNKKYVRMLMIKEITDALYNQ